jgi:hypothetical protein
MHAIPSAHSAKLLNRTPLFEVLGYGYSYQTDVVMLVRNTFTQMRELWITPVHHSQSTQRHVGYYRAGFGAWYHKNYPSVLPTDQIFVTQAVPDGAMRNHAGHAQATLRMLNAFLCDVDIPRTREATRRGVLTSCSVKVDRAIRLMCQGIPANEIHAETIINLYDFQAFVTALSAVPDIEEVRAAVRAHIALNHPNNN